MYSITSQASFDRIKHLREVIMQTKRATQIVYTLVANKLDCTLEREVSAQAGAALARHWGVTFFEISAKTANTVDPVFTDLIRILRWQQGEITKTTEIASRGAEGMSKRCIIM